MIRMNIFVTVFVFLTFLNLGVWAQEERISPDDEAANAVLKKAIELGDKKIGIEKESQKVKKEAEPEAEEEKAAVQKGETTGEWSEARFRFEQEENRRILLLALMAMTVMVLLVVLFCLHKTGSCTAMNIVHGSGLVLIIFSTIFLVIVADVDQQLTAGIGIIGAVAGYLFGSYTRGLAADKGEKGGA